MCVLIKRSAQPRAVKQVYACVMQLNGRQLACSEMRARWSRIESKSVFNLHRNKWNDMMCAVGINRIPLIARAPLCVNVKYAR